MLVLTDHQVSTKINFINDYLHAENAASGSSFDPNANVSFKNIATLEAELNKDINIQINRKLVFNKIEELFGSELAREYLRQIKQHEIYVHDETSLKPYCASISMYPFLLNGLKGLGGESLPPNHLESYCGSFINLIFAISAQFAGAIATVEFLLYFDHFARNDYGDDYLEEHAKIIENHFQHIVYSINQPAAARGYQSVFWNISIYDKSYFDSLFGSFVFPNGDRPDYESVKKLQWYFMNWFNQERKKSILTFPVITAAMLIDENGPVDREFTGSCSKELANGNSFFIYQSKSADSLASCCRLRNEISDNTFSYSLGAGGVSTGSINVITINMNRLVQDKRDLKTEVQKIHKYQIAYKNLMDDFFNHDMLPVYTAGFISLKKQFLTIGINGMVEAAESAGIKPTNNEEYINFVGGLLKIIYDANIEAKKKYGHMFNTEFVPAENLGVKNAKWDMVDGYQVSRNCYNSYFYVVEDESTNVVDKFVLHGEKINRYLDGGSALHLNLDEVLNQEGFRKIINLSAQTGCNYFCTNVKITICNECGCIDKRTLRLCGQCGSDNVDYGTRVIGYLKRISSFSNARQVENKLRYYHRKTERPKVMV
ncbi:MAG: anaerobic ribonucleoside-triphosphate reductase [Bacteriovoracaceae bacterium]|nr:anaerobic ribonucleoside-triphosphate reductase [Bacteriovoracaceae bacterium]